jgi:hypothetical protein
LKKRKRKREKGKREKGVSQHILTDETGSRQGHFFGFAFLHWDWTGRLVQDAMLYVIHV